MMKMRRAALWAWSFRPGAWAIALLVALELRSMCPQQLSGPSERPRPLA